MHIEFLPGQNLLRAAIARHIAGDTGAVAYAAQRWGARSDVVQVTRAAVGGVSADDMLDGEQASAAAAFIEAVTAQTILGKLQGLRRVPPSEPYRSADDAASAAWVPEGSNIPVSRASFDRDTLDALRVASIMVVTRETLTRGAMHEALLLRDLQRAVALETDRSFIDPANTGGGGTPASVTNGAAVASTGDPIEDIEMAAGLFLGDWQFASWIMSPQLALTLALRLKGSGLADLGPRGGTLAGLPAIVSQAVPTDSTGETLALVDGSGIAICDQGVDIKLSESGTVRMADDPAGTTLTPTGGGAAVSLFQCDGVGARAVRRCNWASGRTGGVVAVTGIAYGASA